jgi:hypothetical protein
MAMVCRLPVCLYSLIAEIWLGSLRFAEDFGSLIGKDAESVSEKDFDPQGQYKKVIEAVKKAGGKDVGFFSVDVDKTRTEYYVVSVTKGKVVGLKAVAVQS